ncbi:MAG: glutathione S-transferase [Deltaproteobacteria bacterium]|nr:glutathione S-transferase [Deltaproteobacteria bacterium]
MTKVKLYQFAISHYCEKARWALDYKGIDYKRINLIPGPHLLTTRRLAEKTSVPILLDDGKAIQGSGAIISYLDKMVPEKPLMPQEADLEKEALEIEDYCDREIGVHLRRYFYNTLLWDRPLVTSLLLQDGPKYGPALYAVMFPVVRKLMCKSMNINPESAKRSEQRLTDGIETLNKILSKQKFLVGKDFSRADIAAAALIAPLVQPKEHDFRWPNVFPEPLAAFRREHERDPFFPWVLKMYRECRKIRRY